MVVNCALQCCVFSCLCVYAAWIPPLLPTVFLFLFLSLFSRCESWLCSGARLRPQGFTSHTPRWQFVVAHTDNDLHFSLLPDLMALCLWVCECVTRPNGIFYESVLNGNTCFVHLSVSLAVCVSRPDSIWSVRYRSISGCEWYITSPAGWSELVVSFVISIDEFSLGESISRGCSLVDQPPPFYPPPLAVSNWCVCSLTFFSSAAPQRASTAEHRERWSSSKQLWCN